MIPPRCMHSAIIYNTHVCTWYDHGKQRLPVLKSAGESVVPIGDSVVLLTVSETQHFWLQTHKQDAHTSHIHTHTHTHTHTRLHIHTHSYTHEQTHDESRAKPLRWSP